MIRRVQACFPLLVLALLFSHALVTAGTPTLTVMQNWPKGFGDRSPDYEDVFWQRAENELRVTIEMLYAPSHQEYMDKLPVMVASGTAPDVVLFAAQSHWAAGLFEPLTPFIEKTQFPIRNFLPGAVSVWTSQGQLYAIPSSRNHILFVYNADAFAEAGVADPPTQWNADHGWNWQYVRQLAQKLTRSDGHAVTRHGIEGFQWEGVWPHYFGADWVDEGLNLTISSPSTVRAIEFFADFHRQPSRGGSVTSGTAVMGNGMSWSVNGYVAADRNLRFAPTPIGTTQATVAYTDGAAMLCSSTKKDLAWQFLTWLFKPENAAGFFSHQWNYLVPMRNIRRYWEETLESRLGDALRTTRYAEVFYSAGEYGVMSKLFSDLKFASLWPNITSWQPDNVLFGANFGKVLSGDVPAATHLAEAERLLSNMLSQSPTAPR